MNRTREAFDHLDTWNAAAKEHHFEVRQRQGHEHFEALAPESGNVHVGYWNGASGYLHIPLHEPLIDRPEPDPETLPFNPEEG